MGDQIAANIIGIDEMGHAEFFRQGALARIGIDANNHVGADHAGAL